MNFEYDFINVHNDDLIPIDSYEGITIYRVNYEQALEREREFIRKMIALRKHSTVEEHVQQQL